MKLVIVDFGSQYTHLITKAIRDFNIRYIVLDEIPETLTDDIKGIILSGGPNYVSDIPSDRLENINVPILGICFGAQYIANYYGIEIVKNESSEYGRTKVKINNRCDLFRSINEQFIDVWMSHANSIKKDTQYRETYEIISQSETGSIAGFKIRNCDIYGLLFHPEVSHTDYGIKMIGHFVFKICNINNFVEPIDILFEIEENIKKKVGDDHVLMAVSGGVDSSVAAMLIHGVIGERLHCVFIDNGLLREGEYEEVLKCYKEELKLNVIGIDAKKRFYNALKGITSPEEKRKIIGRVFVETFKHCSIDIDNDYDIVFLGQGTIYSDVIESSVKSKHSKTIKSHHNVGGLPEELGFELLEPLRNYFKDEVRSVGRLLNIPELIIGRHPFPGPGLAIRIIGEITEKKVYILQKADKIYIDMLREYNLYNKIWQAGSILLNTQSVGVMGDNRTYEYVLALRAVCSKDGMTAQVYPFEVEFLEKVSTKIINNVEGINRVVYDISNKPPATIEWE
tara:strand:+ start:30951 stop:32480 length:1530 start_codon:yes stop_codon:yes gene_type:complete